jgi:hypothetical protein
MLVSLLRANRDIFAWKPTDMPGVPKELIEPCLKVDPKATPKKQRLWRFTPDKSEAIEKELAKVLTAGLLRKCTTLSGPLRAPTHRPSHQLHGRLRLALLPRLLLGLPPDSSQGRKIRLKQRSSPPLEHMHTL